MVVGLRYAYRLRAGLLWSAAGKEDNRIISMYPGRSIDGRSGQENIMKFELLLAAMKSVADMIKGWFGWIANKEKQKKDSIDRTASGIGKGKPFLILVLLFVSGCAGYIYTVSTPMAFDKKDFQYVKKNQSFIVPANGYFFSDEALEKYIRSKVAQYEIDKRGFYHKGGE